MTQVQALLDIDQASQLTGLPPATLRNWEKRYGFPSPQRTEGGHRLYQVSEIRKIQEVVRLQNNGLKVKEAIDTVLKGAALEVPAPSQPLTTTPAIAPSLSEGITHVLQALYKFDLKLAEERLSKLGMRLSEMDLLEMVYPQLLTQIGDDWENSRINVAQEHFSWNFVRVRLLNYYRTSHSNMVRPTAILATPEGELHEGGLLVLGAYLMMRDWEVYYLGANLPFEDLEKASQAIKPDMICLSAIDDSAIRKNWASLHHLQYPVAIGGQCVHGLKSHPHHKSPHVILIEGGLSSALTQLELNIQANKSIQL